AAAGPSSPPRGAAVVGAGDIALRLVAVAPVAVGALDRTPGCVDTDVVTRPILQRLRLGLAVAGRGVQQLPSGDSVVHLVGRWFVGRSFPVFFAVHHDSSPETSAFRRTGLTS